MYNRSNVVEKFSPLCVLCPVESDVGGTNRAWVGPIQFHRDRRKQHRSSCVERWQRPSGLSDVAIGGGKPRMFEESGREASGPTVRLQTTAAAGGGRRGSKRGPLGRIWRRMKCPGWGSRSSSCTVGAKPAAVVRRGRLHGVGEGESIAG